MSLKAEVLVDRRRLQRRLTYWRIGAIILVVLLIAAVVSRDEGFKGLVGQNDHIARVAIVGLITDNHKQQQMLDKIAKNDDVKAVLLRVNSPGGTTTGGEALFEAIRRVSEKKPVVAVFGTVAASAAYIAGLACDYIVARGNTITGSVGVIFQFAEVTNLLEKLGVKVEEVKSGPLKANPSPFSKLDEAGKQLSEDMVAEAHAWFLELVTTRRSISPQSVKGLKDGRIFSGRQAQKLKLIDAIGGEEQAVKWLEENKGIKPDLKIVDWKPKNGNLTSFITGLARLLGYLTGVSVEKTVNFIGLDESFLRLQLDGLISVWHPRGN